MRILLVEDSELIIQFLSDTIKTHYFDWQIDTAENYDTAVIYAKENHYDLFILDYELDIHNSQKNGLALGIQIQKMSKYIDVPIIFETSYSEYIFDAVNKLNCIYYLMKPYDETDVLKMLDKIKKQQEKDLRLSFSDPNHIQFYVKVSEIVYVSSGHNRLTIVTENTSYICTNFTLNTLETECHGLLLRCHKSFLFNPNYIQNIDRSNRYITLNLPTHIATPQIPIGRKYLTLLTERNLI